MGNQHLDTQTVSRFLAGELDRDALAAAEAHLSDCAECRAVVAAVVTEDAESAGDDSPPAPGQPMGPGTVLGRYEIQDLVGAGGMGSVYRAYDPELGRHVAIKLVRMLGEDPTGSTGEEQESRLIREARALAKLRHPNVVRIYDVGTVTTTGDVFIAMELLEGDTLRDWLAAEPRKPQEILRVLADAGAGLAAAHELGLIHRDFKPTNVVIDADRRALVLDFGLVRQANEREASQVDGDAKAGNLILTRTGSTLGTPLYMAPEQFLGQEVDARSDQFSFCVTLYEALCGRRPFEGSTFGQIRKAVIDSDPAPLEASVPRRVRQAILRGLRREPDERFASMDELLALLQPRPRRWPYVAAGAVVLASLAGLGWTRWQSGERLCAGADKQLEGVWDTSRKAQVERAFASLKLPYGQRTVDALGAKLDTYRAEWIAMHTEACRATHVTRAQSSAVLDLRMNCLQRRRGELDALVERLTVVDADSASQALVAASSLSPVDTCGRTDQLGAIEPLPASEAVREQIERLRAQLADVKAALNLGHIDRARELVTPTGEEARTVDYGPLRAEADYWMGRTRAAAAEYEQAASVLQRAVWEATGAGDDRQVVLATASLVHVQGSELAKTELGSLWLGLGRASLERMGPDPDLALRLDEEEANLLAASGKYEEADALAVRVASDYAARFGDDSVQYARALEQRGFYAERQYRYDEALDDYRRAMSVWEKRYGAEHPSTASNLTSMGTALAASGKFAEALDQYEKALAIQEKVLGPEHADVGKTYHNMGYPLIVQKKYDRAEEVYTRALEILAARLGPEHHRLASTYYQMGYLYFSQGRYDEALASYQKALDIRVAAFGSDHAMVGDIALEIANTHRAEKRWQEALENYQRSIEVRRKALGPDHLKVWYTIADAASCQIELGQYEEATLALESVRAAYKRLDGVYEPLVHFADFQLARALYESGDGDRALELARSAQAGYETLENSEQAQMVATWLANK